MRLFKYFCVLSITIIGLTSSALNDANWSLPLLPLDGSNGAIDAVGGSQEFKAEVKYALAAASDLRNGTALSCVQFEVSSTTVAKFCFTDGVCWAAKFGKINSDENEVLRRRVLLLLLETYCPHIPISKYRGEGQNKLHYEFTEWIEGITLMEVAEVTNFEHDPTYTFPNKVITSLAEFIYNLTTCQIPREKITFLQRDNVADFGYAIRNDTELARMNATTWAKRQFTAWHLLNTSCVVEQLDGLDKMLLLVWILKKLSNSDSQPFVLHFWDLRPPNIMVDNDANVIGIIDWDDVTPIPLKLSAISIAEILGDSRAYKVKLNDKQAQFFQREITRFEQENLSTAWSNMFRESRENKFLFQLTRPCDRSRMTRMIKEFPDIMADAIRRTPEKLEAAAFEWGLFKETYFGGSLPDCVIYTEIQDGLREYNKFSLERVLKRFKRSLQYRFGVLWDKFWRRDKKQRPRFEE